MNVQEAEVDEDLAALREGAALIERDFDLLTAAGPDRLRLLQGLVTADLKGLASGSAVAGFFTTGQGRILADFRLVAKDESCWLLLPGGTANTVRAHLEKYKLASQVEISTAGDRRLFELCGPRAAEAADLASDGSGEVGELLAVNGPATKRSFFLLPQAADAESQLTSWLRRAEPLRVRRVGAAASEIARVEDGELRFGVDFSTENFPQETGREGDVSYTKGCYLGQEVVARIHYRGGVQRQPRGLHFTAGGTPEAGKELILEGRPVGRATSVAQSPRFGAIGLGLLHQRGSAPGTKLEIEGGGEAEVVALPFGSDVVSGVG